MENLRSPKSPQQQWGCGSCLDALNWIVWIQTSLGLPNPREHVCVSYNWRI